MKVSGKVLRVKNNHLEKLKQRADYDYLISLAQVTHDREEMRTGYKDRQKILQDIEKNK